jgi:alpha/beta superfamily hydrolase
MSERRVTFKSEDLTLEGLLAVPAQAARGAVVCHPHPQSGGSMYNNVVEAVLDALRALDYATLRFNFRGVGESEGAFADGVGEVLDAKAAVRFLAGQQDIGETGMLLAGYSFGATVALRAGLELAEVGTVIAVAPPIGMADLSFIVGTDKRVILIAGDRDAYCPAAEITALQKKLTGPSVLKLIAGADHFFGGYEAKLTSAIGSALGA